LLAMCGGWSKLWWGRRLALTAPTIVKIQKCCPRSALVGCHVQRLHPGALGAATRIVSQRSTQPCLIEPLTSSSAITHYYVHAFAETAYTNASASDSQISLTPTNNVRNLATMSCLALGRILYSESKPSNESHPEQYGPQDLVVTLDRRSHLLC
jgi:hypothetical protein